MQMTLSISHPIAHVGNHRLDPQLRESTCEILQQLKDGILAAPDGDKAVIPFKQRADVRRPGAVVPRQKGD